MPPPFPSTAEHREVYRGRELVATAYEQRRGCWSYTWLVDGTLTGSSAPRALLPSAEAALRRATLAARVAIDATG